VAAIRKRNQDAIERTIAALRKLGRIEEVDAGAIGLARHLARSLDEVDVTKYPLAVASLARVQLAALASLRGVEERTPADGIDDLLAALRTPVGNPPQH
jgi:hypothetical protein